MSKPIPSLVAVLILGLSFPVTAAPPPNDACSAATTIRGLELPFTQVLDTTQATADGDPAVACVASAPGKSVWYSFRPETSDTYAFDTGGSTPASYGPVLTLYTGGCGGLAPVPNACARGRLVASLTAGTTYTLVVAGAAVVVDPRIRIAVNGVDLCPSGPGPGGGSCGTVFNVRVGEQISARAYNDINDTLLTTGSFAWSLGTSADPATATGPSAAFKYTTPVASTNVVLTWIPPDQSPMSRQVSMVVTAASGMAPLSGAPAVPPSLTAGETATIPSPGGTLRLLVQRDVPEWRFTSIVPSVAGVINAAGIPYVSDFSVSNTQPVENIVELELWTSAGRRQASLIRLPAYGSRTIRDVVKSAFGLEQTFGSLLVSSTGYVTAGARTWAPVATGGTNGQFALAGDVRSPLSSAVLLTGEVGILTGVRQDSAFRTNIGVYNLSEKECLVEVEAHDDEGRRVGSQLVLTVPATRYVQQSLGDATGNNLASGSVRLTNATTGCAVGGVAYVIDNVTQDPLAVSQRKSP
jgi:hypothetical protein